MIFVNFSFRVVEVKGIEMAKKAIDILHRSEIKGRRIVVREVCGVLFHLVDTGYWCYSTCV